MFDFNIALQSLIGITVFLTLLFFFLLGYTFWTRKKQQYWNSYEEKFRDHFFSLLLDYAEQSNPKLSADKIVKKISKRTKDYTFFIKLLDELDDILDGPERKRLNNLIKHPIFASFYREKLFRFSVDSKLYACIYFQKSAHLDDRVLAKLTTVSQSNNLKLAFAATKALQSAKDWTVCKSALLRFFKRTDISELMVAELLHIFDSGLAEDREKVGEALKDLLLKKIDPDIKNIIVRYMGYQQFYQYGEFLHQCLKRIDYSPKMFSLIKGLIIALGELYHTESASTIKSYWGKEKNTPIRLASVQTLSIFGEKENLSFLLQNLLKAEFPIRKAIIYEFIKEGEKRIELLTEFIKETQQSLLEITVTRRSHEQLDLYLDKILDITSGIKIALNHRLNKSYA
ncbi:HEAT repeat domain-containing protein [Fodinibius sp. AD559]|uniref:HEAT repeat domain-containing protein n=1 Tax=Fodinibius sp. AD559 TaxID=3424179 RepID=UPI004046C2A4